MSVRFHISFLPEDEEITENEVENAEIEEINQNSNISDSDSDNLSEQEKMDNLIAELSGESDDPVNKDLNNNDDNKSEPPDNIKITEFEDIDQKSNSADSDNDNLSEQENDKNKSASDDFNSLDDDEIESFDANVSAEIPDKNLTKTDENNNLNISVEKKNAEKKPKNNRLKRQIPIKKHLKSLISLFLLLILFFQYGLYIKIKLKKTVL